MWMGCRVGTDGGTRKINPAKRPTVTAYGNGLNGGGCEPTNAGRWPANLCHDGSQEVLDLFPDSKSTGGQASLGAFRAGKIYGSGRDEVKAVDPGYGDSGSASPVFLQCRTSKKMARPRPANIDCERCGKSFYPIKRTRRFCSKECSGAINAAIGAERSKLPGTKYERLGAAIRSDRNAAYRNNPEYRKKVLARAAARKAHPVRQPCQHCGNPGLTGIIMITISLSRHRMDLSALPHSISPRRTWNLGSRSQRLGSRTAQKPLKPTALAPSIRPSSPISFMQWLCRLITPPGGTILDPFSGSGTTGAAAIAEGFRPILIEREEEYLADIERRMDRPVAEINAEADEVVERLGRAVAPHSTISAKAAE